MFDNRNRKYSLSTDRGKGRFVAVRDDPWPDGTLHRNNKDHFFVHIHTHTHTHRDPSHAEPMEPRGDVSTFNVR